MKVFAIYKKLGISSYSALNEVKKEFKTKKVGHLGTLDPLAEGILVVAVKTSTKLIPYIEAEPKEYIVEIFLGQTTPSLDAEGIDKELVLKNALANKSDDLSWNPENFENILDELKQQEWQVPPKFSAVHVNGKRAYELARSGVEEIDIPAKKVSLLEYEILNIDYPLLKLRLLTSSGYYVRSLVRDLAKKLGTKAFMYSLKRSRVGNFSEDQLELDQSNLIFKDYFEYEITEEENKDLRDGKLISTSLTNQKDLVYVVCNGKLVSICTSFEEGGSIYLKVLRNLNL